ncbi:MAG: hypothetical protein FWE38_05140 [Firmicutes bacterium]|nr:hypothetical protein [Bacillota bacterium]
MRDLFTIDAKSDPTDISNRPYFHTDPNNAAIREITDKTAEFESIQKTQDRRTRPFRIILMISGFYAMIALIGLIEGLLDVNFATAWNNAAWLIVSIPAATALAIISLIILIRANRKFATSLDADRMVQLDETIGLLAKHHFNIPDDAPRVEIICAVHKTKRDGTQKTLPVKNNMLMHLVHRDGNICFIGSDFMVKIPMELYRGAEQLEREKISFVNMPRIDITPDERKPLIRDYKIYFHESKWYIRGMGRLLFADADGPFAVNIMRYDFITAKNFIEGVANGI